MPSITLTKHDMNVLEKIKDPESDPSSAVFIDPGMARDPHVTNKNAYDKLVEKERDILLSVQQIEMELAGLRPMSGKDPKVAYQECVEKLDRLVDEFPKYASVRNNRAQALRRLYGDTVLVSVKGPASTALLQQVNKSEVGRVATKILDDLDEAIKLLSPATPFAAISQQQAKTLSLLHTQRAAIYHETSKRLPGASFCVNSARRETPWSRLQFEEAASLDFAMGGRYGCDIAKGLAVSTNPTAKLCGQMVREAMKKEYGPEYGT